MFNLNLFVIMANIKFSVKFNAFVNYYFNVENVKTLNVEFLKDCGFYSDYFDFSDLGENIKNEEDFLRFILDNYDKTAAIEFVPDKFNTFARVTIDGKTITLQFDDDDDFISMYETSRKHEETYKGHDIFSANIANNGVLYCYAYNSKYPDYYIYFASLDDVKKYIDLRNK